MYLVIIQNFDQSFLIRALQNLDNKIPFHVYLEIKINSYPYKLDHLYLKIAYLFLDKSLDYLTKTIDDNDRISLKQEFGKIINY